MEAKSDVNDKDTDDDAISDYDEVFKFFTDPTKVDTDGDGIQDGTEVGRGRLDYIEGHTDRSVFFPDQVQINNLLTTGDPLYTYS